MYASYLQILEAELFLSLLSSKIVLSFLSFPTLLLPWLSSLHSVCPSFGRMPCHVMPSQHPANLWHTSGTNGVESPQEVEHQALYKRKSRALSCQRTWWQNHSYPHSLFLTCSPATLHFPFYLVTWQDCHISPAAPLFISLGEKKHSLVSNSGWQWPLWRQAALQTFWNGMLLAFLLLLCQQPRYILQSQSKLALTNELRVGWCRQRKNIYCQLCIVSFLWLICWLSLGEL